MTRSCLKPKPTALADGDFCGALRIGEVDYRVTALRGCYGSYEIFVYANDHFAGDGTITRGLEGLAGVVEIDGKLWMASGHRMFDSLELDWHEQPQT